MEKQPNIGILEEFRIDFLEAWDRLPNKGYFLILVVAWLALFQFLGNATLGYIHTSSLLQWMWSAYASNPDTAATDDSHGKFIPWVVLALFWWKRKELLAVKFRIWAPALGLIAFAALLHVVGYMIQQPRLSIIALFVGIYGAMGLAWGPQWLRECFFPYFLLAFCVPLGWQAISITFPLRVLVVHIVDAVCGYLLQIDVKVDGTQIMDPNGKFQYEVAAACSGMRSLLATVAVSMIYAMLSFRTWWKRGLLMISSVPLAVLGNVVRMLTIVVAADLGGQEAGNSVHEGGPLGVYSLLPYIPAFAGLFLLGHWLREPEDVSSTSGPGENPKTDVPKDATGVSALHGRPIDAVQ